MFVLLVLTERVAARRTTTFLEAVAGNQRKASTCICNCGCFGDCATCCGYPQPPDECCCGIGECNAIVGTGCCNTCQQRMGFVKVATYNSSGNCSGTANERTFVNSVCAYLSDKNYIRYTCQDGGDSVLYEQHTDEVCYNKPVRTGTVAVRSCHAPTSGLGQSEDVSCVPGASS